MPLLHELLVSDSVSLRPHAQRLDEYRAVLLQSEQVGNIIGVKTTGDAMNYEKSKELEAQNLVGPDLDANAELV